jgi:hypothetical protein
MDVRDALSTLLEPAPPMRLTVADHVRRGESLRARRRAWLASGAAGLLVVATVALLEAPRVRTQATPAGVSSSIPGGDIVRHLAAPVTVIKTGTATIELGPPPAGATAIDLQLICLSAGTFTMADGANASCSADDAGTSKTGYTLPLKAGEHSTSIAAGSGERWQLTATYSTIVHTPWGVNRNGQTYGSQNSRGTPVLLAVIATNGKTGYAYSKQVLIARTGPGQAAPSPATVPVYESDGVTVIGAFNLVSDQGVTTHESAPAP